MSAPRVGREKRCGKCFWYDKGCYAPVPAHISGEDGPASWLIVRASDVRDCPAFTGGSFIERVKALCEAASGVLRCDLPYWTDKTNSALAAVLASPELSEAEMKGRKG